MARYLYDYIRQMLRNRNLVKITLREIKMFYISHILFRLERELSNDKRNILRIKFRVFHKTPKFQIRHF